MEEDLYELIEFIKQFNHISVGDLIDIFEFLNDEYMLSGKGIDLYKKILEIFAKEDA